MSSPTVDPTAHDAQQSEAVPPRPAIPPEEPQDVLDVPLPQDTPPDLTADDAPPPGVDDAPPPGLVPAVKAPLSWFAVAALVTGVLPLIPIGLGLGIIGLVTTRRGRRRGRNLAVTGLLATIVWVAIGGTLGTVAALTHGFHRPVKVKYTYVQATVFSLRQGECLNNIPSAESPSLTSCASPHDAEVFATFTLPGASWPGAAAAQQEAQAGCSSRLASYLNPQLAISLTQDYVYPGQVAWQAGTRTVVCEVRATTGQLDQSVGSASATRAS